MQSLSKDFVFELIAQAHIPPYQAAAAMSPKSLDKCSDTAQAALAKVCL